MRFLLFLLQETLGKKYIRATTRKFNWKQLSNISTTQYRKGSKTPAYFRQIKNLRQVLDIYSKLNEKEKQIINEFFMKKYHTYAWNTKYDFASFMQELHLIIKKKQRGAALTKIDDALIQAAKDIFISNKRTSYYKPLISSWLISCKYTKSSKTLWVHMKDGHAIYKFYGVPEDAYILLITIASKAGTYWYREKYGSKYSLNPQYWIKRGG